MSDEPDQARFKVFAVPADVAEFCRDISHELATELGESPEAWRGAAVMAYFIKCCCSAEATTQAEDTGDVTPSELSLHLLLTTSMLEQYPTWPKGVAGEPLLIDGDNPPDDIPHFRMKDPNDT